MAKAEILDDASPAGSGRFSSSKSPMPPSGDKRSRPAGSSWASRWAWVPLPVLLVSLLALWAAKPSFSRESVWLVFVVNVPFTLATGVLVAYLLGRSFAGGGMPGLLLLGCGSVFWATAPFAAVLAGDYADFNHLVTVHNLCVWLAAACYVAGVVLSRRPGRRLGERSVWLGAGYVLTVGMVVLVAVAAAEGWVPPFFVQGQGGTAVRQMVLGSAAAMLGLAAWLLASGQPRPVSPFVRWYSPALGLAAVGLFGVMLQSTAGSLLNWTGRLAQVLSGVYMLAAAVASMREAGSWRVSLETALRESKELFGQVFEHAALGIAIGDIEGRVLESNPALERMLGYSKEELRGKRFSEFTHGEDVGREWALAQKVLVGKRDHYEIEKRYLRKDGEVIWVRLRGSTVSGKEGEAVRGIALIEDVTERKRAEEEACRNAERLNLVLQASSVGTFEIDLATGDGQWNAVQFELLGLQPGAARACPETFFKYVHAEDVDSVRGQWEEALRSGKLDAEFRIVRADGEERWLIGRGRFAFEGNVAGTRGRALKFLGVNFDITERKRAEAALRESEQRLRLAHQGAKLGRFEWNVQTGVNVWSPELEAMYGLARGEFGKTQTSWEQLVYPEDRRGAAGLVNEAFETGEPVQGEWRVVWPDGSVHWLTGRFQLFKDSAGKALFLSGVNMDITERKRAEAELAKYREELERLVAERTAKLQELVGELEHFSYTITHDLKSPLRAMRGFAEIAGTFCERLEVKECLGRIATSAERMDRLIADALSYSRSLRQELPLEDVDAGKLLRGMLDSYPELQPDKARIRVEGRLPVVLANEAGLTQCFSNLLGNAVKFVKPGEKADIRVWAQEVQSGTRRVPSEWVRIWVEDQGIGISKEMLPRIFEMFSRGSKNYEGTGIGLALVQKVVQRMGGKVGVESEERKGSRFWIELGRGETRAALGQATEQQLQGSTRYGMVLYVEDEESDALFMERAFAEKGSGEKLRRVGTGRAAIDYLSGSGEFADRERFPVPSVVLLDLNLPQVSGFGVLEWIRNHPDYARLPVVVFSSSTREDDRTKARELGADDFITKPSSGLKFGEVVEGLKERWVEGRRGRGLIVDG